MTACTPLRFSNVPTAHSTSNSSLNVGRFHHAIDDPSRWIFSLQSHYTLNITPPTPIQCCPSSTQAASFIPKLMSTCNRHLRGPQPITTRSKAPNPVGSPSRTAPPHPTHPFSTASNPPKSTAALPAPHALLEEPMSYFTTPETKRDATDSGRASGASQMTRPSLERGRRLSQG